MTVRDPSAWPYCQVITVSGQAVAEGGRGGGVRQIGVFENRPENPVQTRGTAEQRRAASEFLLRSRLLWLWTASVVALTG
jgi:hypothetical protein